MRIRVIDKLLILIPSAVAISTTAGLGVMFITSVLLCLICLVLSELLCNVKCFDIFLSLLPVLAVINTNFLMFIPVSAYMVVTSADFVRVLDYEYERYAMDLPLGKSDISKFIPYVVAFLISMSLLFAMIVRQGGVLIWMTLFLTLFAMYLGGTRAYAEGCLLRSLNNTDTLKLDAIKARRNQKLAVEQQSEAVYTATLEERNRIAREIHDNVGHMITRSLVQMQALKIMNHDKAITPAIESISVTLDEAMTAIRRSVHALHNESIDLAIEVNEASSILKDRFNVDVITSIDIPASTEITETIVAIVKEACTNISKYSNGDKVEVQVAQNITFWRIRIHDNGKNASQSAQSVAILNTKGMGLNDIRERVLNLGGRCEITQDKEGFTVFATIPIKEARK